MGFENILIGLGAGFAYGMAAWKKTAGQDFDLMKFVPTVALGTVGGVVAEFTGMQIDAAVEFLVVMGATGFVENIVKAVMRHLKPVSPAKP